MSKKVYEHLLSQDPIGAFEKIKQDLIRYFSYVYRVNNDELNKERIRRLGEEDNLYKEPYLEILPEYKSVENINGIEDLWKEFVDAFGDEKISKQFFSDFIKQGLMNYTPYVHQKEMLEKAFIQKNNVVITSGTGSGKTESFLLPLLAQLFSEAKTWSKPNYGSIDWFKGKKKEGKKYEPCQRKGETRKSAMRALVLYPMNALVEDQMTRLRRALDNDAIRTFFDSEEGLKGNRIYFGRYTGDSIGSKSHALIEQYKPKQLNDKEKDVAKKLSEIHHKYVNILKHYNSLSDEAKEDDASLFVTPRLDDQSRTSEMLTRWDMQVAPPDIMITNTSMLSIMLMRTAEEDIFKSTREWLNADDIEDTKDKERAKKDRIFHIVVDELHLYRGTAGSEVACLLRMLLNEIGLPPTLTINGKTTPNPQLRILASSASLGDEDATNKYLEEFFGVYSDDTEVKAFVTQKGESYVPNGEIPNDLDYSIFASITPEFIEKQKEEKIDLLNKLISQQGCKDIIGFVYKYQGKIFNDFCNALKKDGDIKPICYTDLYGENCLFTSEDALRGFLIFRAFVDELKDENGKPLNHRLPRFRFHQLFKYVEGLWGELQPTCDHPELAPVANLAYVPNEVGANNRKILELLRCECCGELYIGGNRKKEGEEIIFTLNSPELQKIPTFNPTPMVQNKSFAEYALFWPTSHDEEVDLEEDHVALLSNGKTGFEQTHAKAQWKRGYLDAYTGKFKTDSKKDKDNLIPGFLYSLSAYNNKTYQEDKIQAMPCCCPHCGQNYTRRIYAKSPIRSFRAGMDRMNQLLSKGLIYQLSPKSNKLIGFSDSREDAAKQAYGIELEQYRDMVRYLFIECVKENFNAVENVKSKALELGRVISDRKTLKLAIKGFLDDSPTIPNNSEIIDIVLDIVEGKVGESSLDRYHGIVPLESFIGGNNALDGILIQKLVKLGINPAGVDYENQFYNGDHSRHWSEAFDFDKGTIIKDTGGDYTNTIKESLISAIFSNSFGKYMGVSVLDSGIGYICCKRSQEIEESAEYKTLDAILKPSGVSVYDFVDAYIRILGDNYRYVDPQFENDDITDYEHCGSLKNIVREFSKKKLNERNDLILGNALFAFLKKFVSGTGTKLIFNKLAFKMFADEDTYYECPTCHRIHLHKGFGFCTNTNCKQPFDGTEKTGKVRKLREHFISHDIMVEPKQPRRLHTEELTGQTDNIQERLLEFKDLILIDDNQEQYRKGYETTKKIDMVNVTTTMEVGVDIGSLEAIFQGNMPPTRYNYQQRVGRGGRRGQAFSAAVTCCRGRSHDTYYYYKATEEMLGSIPVAPTLSLAPFEDRNDEGHRQYKMKQAIMKRVIVKSILRETLRGKCFIYDLIDTAGEFGRVCDWKDTNKKIVEEWIAKNSSKIKDIINLYFGQYNRNGIDISQEIEDVYNWISKELVSAINNIASSSPDQLKGLAQCLSENGLLPMYGLPSDLRYFYHGFDNYSNEVKSVDRQLEMSINEFAPGSEKTKDKGRYRVEGITLPMEAHTNYTRTELSLLGESNDALSERFTISFTKDDLSNPDCTIEDIKPECTSDSALDISRNYEKNQRMLVIPHAYRSYRIKDNKGQPIDNNERSSAFSQSIIYAKDNDNGSNVSSIPIGNVKISTYGVGLSDTSEVWHINTNNNLFFAGCYNEEIYPHPKDENMEKLANFMFYKKDGARIQQEADKTIDLALGARKATEMVKLEIREVNDRINLNVSTGNRSAIRAAFFSAAFLIQRTLADKLDVQPDEIEISEKLGGERPIIYLSDALPNGAGLVSYLSQQNNLKSILEDIANFKTDFMQSLVKDNHPKDCLTSCQKCLKTYANRGFHHVLDWRLGVGIIKLMLNSEYDFGFSNRNDKHLELADEDRILKISAKKLSLDYAEDLPVWKKQDIEESETIIIYHPLWDREKTIDKYHISDDVDTIKMYNTFNLLRSDISEDLVTSNGDTGSNNTSVQLDMDSDNDTQDIDIGNNNIILGIPLS